jgi:hypothetical protein
MSTVIKIVEGNIYVNEIRRGRCNQALKFGYHPAVLLDMDGGFRQWFELDSQTLQADIIAAIEGHLKGKVEIARVGQYDLEAKKVLAYQQGFNDQQSGRPKTPNLEDSGIVYGAYLQGWNEGLALKKGKRRT